MGEKPKRAINDRPYERGFRCGGEDTRKGHPYGGDGVGGKYVGANIVRPHSKKQLSHLG